jgi:ketosteroid isomerase-like protein
MRNNNLIRGKMAIDLYFKNQTLDTSVYLTWKPDFVDVAASGDMRYTYGQYVFSCVDSAGKIIEDKGIFHTVWKRQADNTWKFVWD